MFILVLFSVLTKLKFIHPELGEQSSLQYFRVILTGVLYSATKTTLFLLEILQIHPMIVFASLTEGKLPFWAALMHEA